MRTFSIQTLGCKVNQYESDQIAQILRARGLIQTNGEAVDLRIINTCSVTTAAGKDSRSLTRKAAGSGSRTIVTGCWATSDTLVARSLGVDAVLTHHDDVAEKLAELLSQWDVSPQTDNTTAASVGFAFSPSPGTPREGCGEGSSGSEKVSCNESLPPTPTLSRMGRGSVGTHALPLLTDRQSSHQRAFLKIQDGCDAHCTYCIIPQLRPGVWSKPVEDVVHEATQLVDAGHHELVLTGIFLGAYGQETALRRRQKHRIAPVRQLIDALCTRVPGLRRLRLSSLEPGDLSPELIATLKAHPQVVPHFHLPLQSGSDLILRRMNRQYTRSDFLRMIDEVNANFDRPALTTDIIVGFPGESDAEFARTLEVVDQAKFIHIHAFSFSPRPGTAAARWTNDFVRGPVVNQRIAMLNARAGQYSLAFREQFIGEAVEVLVEQFEDSNSPFRHGRCERYFDVHFEGSFEAGEAVKVRIERVTASRSVGVPLRRPLAVVVQR
jgi:threonylcarbamoyladenosine tRNA methylthiotransferase MtaB